MTKVLIAVIIASGGYNILWLVAGSQANLFEDYGDVGYLRRMHDLIYRKWLAWVCLVISVAAMVLLIRVLGS